MSVLDREVLTTGQVAALCHVTSNTVSKWVDSGTLAGYRIPGTRERRIPFGNLVDFMRLHGLPLNHLRVQRRRVMIIDADVDAAAILATVLRQELGYDVSSSSDAFDAGVSAARFEPHVIFLDLDMFGASRAGCAARQLKSDPNLKLTRLIGCAAAIEQYDRRALASAGFDALIAKPLRSTDVMNQIERSPFESTRRTRTDPARPRETLPAADSEKKPRMDLRGSLVDAKVLA